MVDLSHLPAAGTYFFWNVWLNAMLAIFIRLNKQDAVRLPPWLECRHVLFCRLVVSKHEELYPLTAPYKQRADRAAGHEDDQQDATGACKRQGHREGRRAKHVCAGRGCCSKPGQGSCRQEVEHRARHTRA